MSQPERMNLSTFAEKFTDMKNIRRAMALKEMEIKEAGGRPPYFSISFYTRKGEVKHVQRAQTCGLKMDMTANRMRGIQEYDIHGMPVGHPIPVRIDFIRTFNEQRVIL